MAKPSDLSGIREGLEVGRIFLQHEAESAFLETGVAKDPYEPQVEIANSFQKILCLMGANRCLRRDTEVLMWDGTIQQLLGIQIGDVVTAYDFASNSFVPSRVNGVFHNGERWLSRYRHSEGVLECTASHKVAVQYPKTGRTAMIRVNRAVKDQIPVIVRSKTTGAPILSRIERIQEDAWLEDTMDIQIDHNDHAFIANGIVCSNSGKSQLGAYKMAWDATGLYPSWYQGPRTVRGIDAWVLGKTGEITRDSCQKKLFGPDPERPGWTDKPGIDGLIPKKYIIGNPTRKSAPSGCFDTVRIKHIPSDTTSILTFKSYEMDRQSLAAWSGDRVWIDEECPLEIIFEIVARLMDTRGQMLITMCPLDGVTPTVKFLQTSPPDLVKYAVLKHTHAKHLAQEEKDNIKRLYASNPAELAARTEGEASSNFGLIFPFPSKDILYNPARISLSPHWKYLGGLDVGWRHPTAACAAAYDNMTDTIFCYATYEQAEQDYFYHHAQLQKWHENMSFMIDPASNQVSQADGTKILEKYWELAHGKNYEDIEETKRKYIKANNSFMPGMDEMWHRFNSGRLRLSLNLRTLIEQYESYAWDKEGKGPKRETPTLRFDVITSLRYLVMGVNQYAHTLESVPPWQEGEEFEEPIEVKDWKRFKAGSD